MGTKLSLQKSADPFERSTNRWPPRRPLQRESQRDPDTVMLLFVSLQRDNAEMHRQGWSFGVSQDKGHSPVSEVGHNHNHEVSDRVPRSSGPAGCSVAVPGRDLGAAFVEMGAVALLYYSDLWIESPAWYMYMQSTKDPSVPSVPRTNLELSEQGARLHMQARLPRPRPKPRRTDRWPGTTHVVRATCHSHSHNRARRNTKPTARALQAPRQPATPPVRTGQRRCEAAARPTPCY